MDKDLKQLTIDVLNFYANQLLDYNEVVSQELLQDRGALAKALIQSLEVAPSTHSSK